MDDWIEHVGDQRDVLEEMHFPRFRNDHPYVLVVRVMGFHVAKLHADLRTTCQKHEPSSGIGPLTLLL